MKTLVSLFAGILFIVNCDGQNIPGLGFYNTTQYNAAYAGQDHKYSVQAGVLLHEDIFKSYYYTYGNSVPQNYQAGVTTDLDKLKSGIGAIVSLTKAGYKDLYSGSLLYNYHVKIDTNSNLRIGAAFNYRILDTKLLLSGNHNFNSYEESNESESSFLFDPAVWYQYKGFNVGVSVENVNGEELYTKNYHFITYYDALEASVIRIIPYFRFSLNHKDSQNLTEINPHLNLEIAKVVVLNGGWTHAKYDSDTSDLLTGGLGFKLNENSSVLMFNYNHLDNTDVDYWSAFVKVVW